MAESASCPPTHFRWPWGSWANSLLRTTTSVGCACLHLGFVELGWAWWEQWHFAGLWQAEPWEGFLSGKRENTFVLLLSLQDKGYGKPWLRTKKQESHSPLMLLMVQPRSVLLGKRTIKRTSCCINPKGTFSSFCNRVSTCACLDFHYPFLHQKAWGGAEKVFRAITEAAGQRRKKMRNTAACKPFTALENERF